MSVLVLLVLAPALAVIVRDATWRELVRVVMGFSVAYVLVILAWLAVLA